MGEVDLGRWIVEGTSDGSVVAGTAVRVRASAGVVVVGPPGGPTLEVPADSRHIDVVRGRLQLVSSDGITTELAPGSGQDPVAAANEILGGVDVAQVIEAHGAPAGIGPETEPSLGARRTRARKPLSRRQRWGCLGLLAFGAVLLAYMAVRPRADPYNGVDTTRFTTLTCAEWLGLGPNQQAGFAQLAWDVAKLNAKTDQAKANLNQGKLSEWIGLTTDYCRTVPGTDLAFVVVP